MRAFLSVAASVCLIAVLAAQDTSSPQPLPTFRGGVNAIRVDMYVTTRDGEPITDLRPEDVEVLEDGRPQAITGFERVDVRAAAPGDRADPVSLADSQRLAAEPRARVFVIFLDTYHTSIEGSTNLRLPLVRFIDRLLGPDDMVAIMTPEMSAADITFVRKSTVISNVMQADWSWARGGGALASGKEALYEACYTGSVLTEMKQRRRERLTLDALDDLVTSLQGVRDERKGVLVISEGWRVFQPNRSLVASHVPELPAPFGRAGAERSDGRATGVERVECEADRHTLAEMDSRPRLRSLTEMANRGNVTFYPIYPLAQTPLGPSPGAGTRPEPVGDTDGLRSRQDALRGLADETDGMPVLAAADVERALVRIVEDLSSYYLLSYYSTNTNLDGKFRNISVRVARPGARVRARRGYRGATAEDVLAAAAGARPDALAVPPQVVVNARAPFRIRSSSWTTGVDGGVAGAVWLVGELDFATRRELAWSAGASAEVSVVSGAGVAVAEVTLPVQSDEGAFTWSLSTDAALPPGDYAVRVRVTPDTGTAVPLTDIARVTVPDEAALLGEAVLWRRGPSTGPRYMATADPRFQRSDRIRLELPSSAPGMASARLLDRTGAALAIPVTVGERPDASGRFRWLVADAALAALAPGDYSIEVALAGATRVTPFRLVP